MTVQGDMALAAPLYDPKVLELPHSQGKFSRLQIDDTFLMLPKNGLCQFMQIVS